MRSNNTLTLPELGNPQQRMELETIENWHFCGFWEFEITDSKTLIFITDSVEGIWIQVFYFLNDRVSNLNLDSNFA